MIQIRKEALTNCQVFLLFFICCVCLCHAQPAIAYEKSTDTADMSLSASSYGVDAHVHMKWELSVVMGEPLLLAKAKWQVGDCVKLVDRPIAGTYCISRGDIPQSVMDQIEVVSLSAMLRVQHTQRSGRGNFLHLDPGVMGKSGGKFSFNVPESPPWDKLFSANAWFSRPSFLSEKKAKQYFQHSRLQTAQTTTWGEVKAEFDLWPVRNYLLEQANKKRLAVFDQETQQVLAKKKAADKGLQNHREEQQQNQPDSQNAAQDNSEDDFLADLMHPPQRQSPKNDDDFLADLINPEPEKPEQIINDIFDDSPERWALVEIDKKRKAWKDEYEKILEKYRHGTLRTQEEKKQKRILISKRKIPKGNIGNIIKEIDGLLEMSATNVRYEMNTNSGLTKYRETYRIRYVGNGKASVYKDFGHDKMGPGDPKPIVGFQKPFDIKSSDINKIQVKPMSVNNDKSSMDYQASTTGRKIYYVFGFFNTSIRVYGIKSAENIANLTRKAIYVANEK